MSPNILVNPFLSHGHALQLGLDVSGERFLAHQDMRVHSTIATDFHGGCQQCAHKRVPGSRDFDIAFFVSPIYSLQRKRQFQITDFFDCNPPYLLFQNRNYLRTENTVFDKQAPDVRVTFIFDD